MTGWAAAGMKLRGGGLRRKLRVKARRSEVREQMRKEMQLQYEGGYRDVDVVPFESIGEGASHLRISVQTGTCKEPVTRLSSTAVIRHKGATAGKMIFGHRCKRKPRDQFDPLVSESDLVFYRISVDVGHQRVVKRVKKTKKRSLDPSKPIFDEIESNVANLYCTLISNDNRNAFIGIHHVHIAGSWQNATLGERMFERLHYKYPSSRFVIHMNSTQHHLWNVVRRAAALTERLLDVGHFTGHRENPLYACD
mmetsp:Transcript_12457/g.30674  ORF Transcript_12457/g.30674 Transcript_12457/m.30674 type:complete len:252 (+) Transcript_12457:250-1005(+)